MKSSQGSASLLVTRSALFLWSLPQWEMIGQSDREEVCRSPSALLSPVFFWCRVWHVSGVIFVECFSFFLFLPYSIPCVFTVLFPYTSGIFLYMCDYWSCIIGWVCLTTARVLCSPSDLYMPVHPMCNKPLYCFWCVSSFVTVTETGFSPTLTLFENLHLVTTLRASCHILWSQKSGKEKKFVSASTLFKVLRNSPQSFGKTFLGLLHFMLMESIFVEISGKAFKIFKHYLTEPPVRSSSAS